VVETSFFPSFFFFLADLGPAFPDLQEGIMRPFQFLHLTFLKFRSPENAAKCTTTVWELSLELPMLFQILCWNVVICSWD